MFSHRAAKLCFAGRCSAEFTRDRKIAYRIALSRFSPKKMSLRAVTDKPLKVFRAMEWDDFLDLARRRQTAIVGPVGGILQGVGVDDFASVNEERSCHLKAVSL